MTDIEAELEWRLARNLADRRERAANEARIAELDKLIAEARLPAAEQPVPAAMGDGASVAIIGLVVLAIIALAVSL